MRAARWLLAVLVVAGTVAGGMTPATAAERDPKPVAWTSTVLAAAAGPGAAAAVNGALSANPEALPGTTPTSSKSAGVAAVVAGGSVSWWCRLSLGLVCAPEKPEGFEPNADVDAPKPPGWLNGDNQHVGQWHSAASWDPNVPGSYIPGPLGQTTVTVTEAPHASATSGRICVRVGYTGYRPAGGEFIFLQLAAQGASNYSYSGAMKIGAEYCATMGNAGAGNWWLRIADQDTGAQSGAWYPVGHQSRPADVVTSFDRFWITTWECSDGTTGESASEGFDEADEEWPAYPPAQCAAPGALVNSITVSQRSFPGGDDVEVYSWERPDATSLGMPVECQNGKCRLILSRVDSTSGAQLSCFDAPTACTGWSGSPEQFKCKVRTPAGTEVEVAIAECKVYTPTFGTATDPSTKGTYGDPITGEPAPDAGGGGGGSGDGACNPAFDFDEGGVGYWVQKGVECAWNAAMVPSAGYVDAKIGGLKSDFGSRPPGSVINAVSGTVGSVGQGWSAGCNGLPDFSPAQDGSLRLPCAPPPSTAWTLAYGFAGVVIVVSTALYLWHMGAAAFSAQSTGE